MNISYLLIGGNEGDREQRLKEARTQIAAAAGPIRNTSSLYETAPWGNPHQGWFLNQALRLETGLDATDLMKTLLAIEEKMGRKRTEKYGARSIDIDMLFFNDAIINEPGLTIPHPEIPNRRFVLVPMDEIAASYVHPVYDRTIRELLGTCTDPLQVKRIGIPHQGKNKA
jgi:2-amino-4-hydroxy-6-hydroxymethyldihydropteridine diphosphokinase